MSYEIVYNSQFIKTREGKIIPLILHGSNNCTEPTFNGRERKFQCNLSIKYVENN